MMMRAGRGADSPRPDPPKHRRREVTLMRRGRCDACGIPWLFVGLTYGHSWIPWILIIVSGRDPKESWLVVPYILGGFVPSIVGVFLLYRIRPVGERPGPGRRPPLAPAPLLHPWHDAGELGNRLVRLLRAAPRPPGTERPDDLDPPLERPEPARRRADPRRLQPRHEPRAPIGPGLLVESSFLALGAFILALRTGADGPRPVKLKEVLP